MIGVRRAVRSLAVGAVIAGFGLTGAAAASAATPAAESAAGPVLAAPALPCPTPVITVSPGAVTAGGEITISGKNFSGCQIPGSPVRPALVLTVRVGAGTGARAAALLGSTRTTADGSFTLRATVPNLPSGGQPRLLIEAASFDPSTRLAYAAVATVTYQAAPVPPTAVPRLFPPQR